MAKVINFKSAAKEKRSERQTARQQRITEHLDKLRINIVDFITTDGLTADPELELPYSEEGMNFARWLMAEFGFPRWPITQRELLGTVHVFYGLVTMAQPAKTESEEEAWHQAGLRALDGTMTWAIPVFEAYYANDKRQLAAELKASNFIENAAVFWQEMKDAQAAAAR